MFVKSSSLSEKQRILKRILTLLIILTLGFIFLQSTLPPEVAAKESEFASDIVSDILPSDSVAEQYAENNMDKIAHVSEFGILGLFVSIYVCAFSLKPFWCGILSFAFNFITAVIDETIQKFSGRMPDIKDVMLDMLGFLCVSIAVYFVYFAFVKSKKKGKNKW